ncbi:ZC3H6 family protein [Megaselia abdita]
MSTEEERKGPPEDDDLEDGEIDDDDEESIVDVKEPLASEKSLEDKSTSVMTIDLTNIEKAENKTKSCVSGDGNDDFADNLEKKMAAILKKEGIIPKIPEIVLEKRKKIREEEALAAVESAQSKASRRRKRKKVHKEKEREKDLEKKRFRSEQKSVVEDDIDEDEMLGMRGASPTRKPDPVTYSSYPQYSSYIDSDYSKDGSYDSYDSCQDGDKPSRKKRNKKKSRWDKDRERDRDDKRKKRRNDSSEETDEDRKGKDEPRKLELCKFYLQECCAKKDQCSYMHQEFPCKYYYLGMDCIYGDDCKYNHGEPLSDEFRNVLLKHIEMAPKEILGSFKRISRDNAINLLNKTHSKLCKKFGVQDTTAHNYKIILKTDLIKQQVSQQIQQKKNQIQELNMNSTSSSQTKIPSLLDLQLPADFVPPTKITDMSSENDDNENDPPKRIRKSRWCAHQSGNSQMVSNNANSGTDLLKLTGVLSNEHIQKLLSAGVNTIEEINQLTVGQLNRINLTAVDVMQIQEKCQHFKNQSGDAEEASLGTIMSTTSQDIDMRVLPIAGPHEKKETICLQSPDNSTHQSYMDQVNPYENLLSESMDDNDDDGDGLIIDDGEMDDEVKSKDNDDIDSESRSDIDSEGRMLPPKITTDAIETFGLLNALKNPTKVDYIGLLRSSNSFDEIQCETKEEKKVSDDCRGDPRLRPNNMFSLSSLISMYKNDDDDGKDSKNQLHSFGLKNSSHTQSIYERKSIYDYASSNSNEDKSGDLFKMGGDKDMRDMQFGLDTDLRLPFQPFMDYKPATEIDGALNGFNQIEYKVFEVDVPPPNFKQLQSKLHEEDNPVDPRLRRMLGLAEKNSKEAGSCQSFSDNDNFDEAIIFQCKTPKLPNTDDESPPNSPPRFYSPFSSTTSTNDSLSKSKQKNQSSGPRLDPRCRNKPLPSNKPAQTFATVPASTTTTNSSVPDIKTYLPSSDWYQNLGSKHKIMVNQQLALVSTELKKFHKDSTPNKIFDMSFILNNQTLQQMLTNLLIFIDDDGQIHRIEQDSDEPGNMIANMHHPPPINVNQPPPFPNFQMDPRNGPPPSQMSFPIMQPQMNMRPGLLGMAPQGFNPFNQPPPPIPQNNNFQQQRPMNTINNNGNINQRRGNNRTNNRSRRL